jgi:H+/Cl- antiporter ClcA
MCVIAAGYLFIYICILCSRFRAKVQASPWWEIFVGLAACSFVLAFIAAGLYAAHFWR